MAILPTDEITVFQHHCSLRTPESNNMYHAIKVNQNIMCSQTEMNLTPQMIIPPSKDLEKHLNVLVINRKQPYLEQHTFYRNICVLQVLG